MINSKIQYARQSFACQGGKIYKCLNRNGRRCVIKHIFGRPAALFMAVALLIIQPYW